jgi:hypothetical protein
MSWLEVVTNIVDRYQSGSSGRSDDDATHEDYQQVAQSAPKDVVTNGIAGMFRSNDTPPFAEMISNLFSESNQNQKAGLLNHLLSAVPPSAIAALPGLGSLAGSAGSNRDAAEHAAGELSPDQVRQIATHAETRDPGVIEKVSAFYAEHPGLMKAVGGMALAVAMKHMRDTPSRS